MKTELAKQISKNQRILESAIREALSNFTKETGVFVTDISFNLQVAKDSSGDPMHCEYYGVRTRLSI